MTARSSATQPLVWMSAVRPLPGLVEGGCWLLSLFLPFAGLVLWARRATGALAEPPATALVCLTALGAVLLTVAVRWLWQIRRVNRRQRSRWMAGVLRWAPTAGLVLLVSGLMVPAVSVWAIVAFMVLVAGEEGCAWVWLSDSAAESKAQRGPREELVRQSWSRSTAADGADVLRGWALASFAAGARTASLHLAFCPPFVATPQLEFRQVDGPAARVKIGQLFPYGARIDVKLDNVTATDTAVKLELLAIRR